MMKFVVLSAVVAVACAAVSVSDPRLATIIRSESDISPEGNYQYVYETDNGISAQAQGALKTVGNEAVLVSQGSFQYQSPEGETIQQQWVSDENGYQPTGSHIPTPPPVPAAILRALEYIAAHPAPAEPQRRN